MERKPLHIGIAGLGAVGASVARLLHDNASSIAQQCGRPVVLRAVSARDKSKDRGLDLSAVTWHDTPAALAADADVDVVVELIGGAAGPAYDLVTAALTAGKPVVTGNKAMLSAHAKALSALVNKHDGVIMFEAAVAGGIPVIKSLREGLAANRIGRIAGILNGTCNFILSVMAETGRAFDDVLSEAQRLGYAEADPSFDIDGVDAAHKLSILSALAFGGFPDIDAIDISGIRHVTAEDISAARHFGFAIRLLGIATPDAKRVAPVLVPLSSPVAHVGGPLNTVCLSGDFSGPVHLTGAGAGGPATASAVVADIIDIARGRALPFFDLPAVTVTAENHAQAPVSGRFYLRGTADVLDRVAAAGISLTRHGGTALTAPVSLSVLQASAGGADMLLRVEDQ